MNETLETQVNGTVILRKKKASMNEAYTLDL